MIEFCETDGNWQAIPPWADFMIRLGHGWPNEERQTRRIAIVSMPCDSAAAGLIALGSLIRDMGKPRSNDLDGHYDRLLRYAEQYLESCVPCDLSHCDPRAKRCGFIKKATGIVRSPRYPRKRHQISDKTDITQGRLAFDDGAVTHWPSSQYLIDWHIDNEPPVRWLKSEGELTANLYRQLVPKAHIHSENLRRTYSGLCLAGRSGGASATREMCAKIQFRDTSDCRKLDELLTIHGWSANGVSRVAFFNTRTAEFDRNGTPQKLVVADGDIASLKVIDDPNFCTGDVIGVIDRTMERDRLEQIGNKISALRQWYVPDEDMLYGLPAVPRGISIAILKRCT